MKEVQPRHDQDQARREAGEARGGVPPPPAGEQAQPQQERGERKLLPGAWDVLEWKARVSVEFCSRRMTYEEYVRKRDEGERLKSEIDEKGTDRDRHILELLYYPRPSLLSSPERELEELQHSRSLLEPLSDEELAECVRHYKEENQRSFRSGGTFHPGVDGRQFIPKQSGKEEHNR
jgi:hypothetical protein